MEGFEQQQSAASSKVWMHKTPALRTQRRIIAGQLARTRSNE
jgi:hypothetical protein